MEISGQILIPVALSQGTESAVSNHRWLCGAQIWSGYYGEKKYLCKGSTKKTLWVKLTVHPRYKQDAGSHGGNVAN